MSALQKLAGVAVLLLIAISSACNLRNKNTTRLGSGPGTTNSAKPADKDLIRSGSGDAKEKPESGKSNVQGKVLYNQQPAANIEVKLCEKFNRFMGGCTGQTYTTRTD